MLVVFDAYGTLFDVQAVRSELEAAWPGHGADLAAALRTKQLEYSFLRGLMGSWVPFRSVTEDALRWVVAAAGLDGDAAAVSGVMEAYDTATPFPDVPECLGALAGREVRSVILTNGSRDMVSRAIESSGIGRWLDAVLSVDAVRRFKPDPAVYALVQQETGVGPEETMLVSSNPFDVAGAATFGFRTCWVNRSGALFDRLGVLPDHEVDSLAAVPAVVG